jgi:hypothetical protein
MQEAEGGQPIQAAGQVQAGGMPGLQGYCQAQHEEHQSINEIDDFVVDGKEILDEVHRKGIIALPNRCFLSGSAEEKLLGNKIISSPAKPVTIDSLHAKLYYIIALAFTRESFLIRYLVILPMRGLWKIFGQGGEYQE